MFKDSIPANTSYEYLLAARKDNGKLLMINTYQFYYAHQPTNPRFIRHIQIPLEDVKNKESITVIIYDFISGKILDHLVFTYKRKDPAHFTYRTYKAIQDEISKLNVKVINNNTKITRTYTYDLWKD